MLPTDFILQFVWQTKQLFPLFFFYDQFIRSRIEYYCNANKRKIDNKNKL